MPEPIGPTVIDTTRPITESPRRDPSADREIGGGRGEERERKAELLGQINKEKGAREVLKAAAANKTGLTPPKEQGAITHDVILNQLKNAGETKDWDIDRMDIPGKLDKSFGWEVEGAEGEEKFKLDPEALKRKERTAKTVDAAAKYVEKSFSGLSPAEQQNIISKVRAGLSGVEVYDAICKADADGGKERIASILKDDALRNEVELKLSLILREAANKQEILAADVNTAKETLEIKKGEPDIIDQQIELKNKELELNKKNQIDYETVGGVKGSKVVEREGIISTGQPDTELITKNNKEIEQQDKFLTELGNKSAVLRSEISSDSNIIQIKEREFNEKNSSIELWKKNLEGREKELAAEKDEVKKKEINEKIAEYKSWINSDTRIRDAAKAEITRLNESITEKRTEIEANEISEKTYKENINILKKENEPHEKKRDLLKNIDDKHKELIENEKKLTQELSDLKLSKIGNVQEVEALEQILNDLISKKAKAEDGIQGDVESVYRKAVIDYLTEKVQESQTAERTLEAEKEKNDQTWMDFNDSLDDEWFKKDKRNDKWLGKKFKTTKVDIDKVNKDFGDIVSGEAKPDDIVKRILMDKCGLTGEEADIKLLEPEFGEKMKGKVIKRLMANKIQSGQLTGSEIFKLVSNTDWGKEALEKAVADNKGLADMFEKARENGIIKGSNKSEWMGQIQAADKHDSNKRWTTGILAALLAILAGGAYFGGAEVVKKIL